MELKIGDYKIISEPKQFIVYHVTTLSEKSKTPGVATDNFVGYYSTLTSALQCLPSRMLMRSDATSLREVADLLERYRLLIEGALKGV